MLENFANDSVPPNPIRGQLWYNTTSNTLNICPADGTTDPSQWVTVTTTSSGGTTTLGSLTVTGPVIASANVTVTNNVSAAGNVIAGNVYTVGNVTGSYLIGNGAFITGLADAYSNANVAAYLPTYSGNFQAGNISITGNGNITGANVISARTINVSQNVVAVGNVTASYFFGNGSGLTGLTASNVGVLQYLSVVGNIDTGNLNSAGKVSAVGNIQSSANIMAGTLSAVDNNVVTFVKSESSLLSTLVALVIPSGQSYTTAPGLRIFDANNLFVLSGQLPTLVGKTVGITLDLQGNINRIWVLSDEEIAQLQQRQQ